MARPTLPVDGTKPWGTILRNAIYDISDRTDAATAVASTASTTATTALNTANTATTNSTANSTAITSLQQALAAKADTNSVVRLTTDQTIAGVKTFSSAPAVPDNSFSIAKIIGLQTALDNAGDGTGGIPTNDPRLTDQRVPTDGSVTNVKVAANANISADKIADGTNNKVLTAALATKLANIASNATVNQTDAYLLSRTNHTGVTPRTGIGTGTPAAGMYVDGGTGAWTTLPTPSSAGSANIMWVANTATSRPSVPAGYQLLIIGGSSAPSWMQAGDLQLATA